MDDIILIQSKIDILSSHDSTLLEEVGEISYKSNKKKNSSSAAATIGSSSAANNKTGKYYSLNANTLHHSPSFNDDANSHQFIETSFGKSKSILVYLLLDAHAYIIYCSG